MSDRRDVVSSRFPAPWKFRENTLDKPVAGCLEFPVVSA
jgi:hypothetical protein